MSKHITNKTPMPTCDNVSKVYPNYLPERHYNKIPEQIEIERIMHSELPAVDKYALAKHQLERLDRRSDEKLELITCANGSDARAFDEATNLYVSAIKAKIELLCCVELSLIHI